MSTKTLKTPNVGKGLTGPYRDAFESSFDAAEAAQLRARAEALIRLRHVLAGWEGTQAEKAKRLGISQPRYSLLMGGSVARFTLDGLVKLAARAGLDSEMVYRPRMAGSTAKAKARHGGVAAHA